MKNRSKSDHDYKWTTSFKTGLHYGVNRSKLVHFKEQKISFAFVNSPSLERLSP